MMMRLRRIDNLKTSIENAWTASNFIEAIRLANLVIDEPSNYNIETFLGVFLRQDWAWMTVQQRNSIFDILFRDIINFELLLNMYPDMEQYITPYLNRNRNPAPSIRNPNGNNIRRNLNPNDNRQAAINSFIRDNTHSAWALDADEEAKFEGCETLIIDADDRFTEFTRKALSICATVNKTAIIRKKTLDSTSAGEIVILKADPYDPADSLVKFLTNADMGKLPFNLNKITVTYKDQEGVGTGVVRTFVSDCITQLSEELMEPVKKGSDFFNIKKNLDVDVADLTKKRSVRRKLVALGYLMGVMIENNMSFPFKIKRSLLHMCLYNTPPSQDASYIVYQLMEDPDDVVPLMNLMTTTAFMETQNDIETANLNFNQVGRKQKKVTPGNFLSYMRNYIEFHYIPSGCKYVVQGFYAKSTAAKNCVKQGYGISEMFDYLSSETQKSNAWIERTKQFVDGITFSTDTPDYIKKLIKKIISDGSPKFVRKLLYFWGGTHDAMPNTEYQVMIGTNTWNENPTGHSKKFCPLPESRTCFFQLVLPQSIPNKDTLEAILKTAVGDVEKGVGNYGGRRRRGGPSKARKNAEIKAVVKKPKQIVSNRQKKSNYRGSI